jgi:hypothetical protein
MGAPVDRSWRAGRKGAVLCSVLLLASACLGTFAIGLTNYLVDPEGVYRRNRACMGPGCVEPVTWPIVAARYLPGEAILVGSSTQQRANVDDVSDAAGQRVINLADIARTTAEQAEMVRFTLQRRPEIRTVYWEIFYGQGLVFGSAYPTYGFTGDVWRQLPYLLAMRVFARSLAILAGRRPVGIDEGYMQVIHADGLGPYSATAVKEGMAAFFVPWQRLGKAERWLSLVDPRPRTTIRETIFPVVKGSPQVEFVFFVPPISVFGALEFDNRLRPYGQTWPNMLKQSLADLIALENVKVFDFQPWREITTDLENYADILHYRPELNTDLMLAMRADRWRIRPEALDQHFVELERLLDEHRERYAEFRRHHAGGL